MNCRHDHNAILEQPFSDRVLLLDTYFTRTVVWIDKTDDTKYLLYVEKKKNALTVFTSPLRTYRM